MEGIVETLPFRAGSFTPLPTVAFMPPLAERPEGHSWTLESVMLPSLKAGVSESWPIKVFAVFGLGV